MLKKLFCPLLAFFFAFSVSAQKNQGLADPDSSEPTIQCQDLLKALESYNEDFQLKLKALTSALAEVSDFLEEASKNKLNQSEFSTMIQNLKDANKLSQKNEMILWDRRDDIEFSLEECLKKIPPPNP